MLRSRSTNILHDTLPRMLLHTTAITLNLKAFGFQPYSFRRHEFGAAMQQNHCRGSQSVSGRRS